MSFPFKDPRWKEQARLSTNQERYRLAHRLWRAPCVPDPNRNLTSFGTVQLPIQHTPLSGMVLHTLPPWAAIVAIHLIGSEVPPLPHTDSTPTIICRPIKSREYGRLAGASGIIKHIVTIIASQWLRNLQSFAYKGYIVWVKPPSASSPFYTGFKV